ncbi:MAG: hypothetical protein ACI4VH_03820 [Clostridia bacterium]
MSRIIQKGNIGSDNIYDVRIIEENGDNYYYHFLRLEDGESVITSGKPFNLRSVVEISWNDLPIKLRNAHFNNLYPNANFNTYEKNCFLYGKQDADEIKRAADQKEREKEQLKEKLNNIAHKSSIYYFEALEIYNAIGDYENVVVTKNGSWKEYIVDDEWVIKKKKGIIVSVLKKFEEKKQKQEWGKRVSKIARLAGTSYNMATIVANISDINEAVSLLKKISNLLNSEEFIIYINPHCLNCGDINFDIKWFLSKELQKEQIERLNWNKKFYNSVEEILKNKK